jgi:hypothetical protein
MTAAAALSILALVGVSGWKVMSLTRADAVATPIAMEDTEQASESIGADWQQELTLLGLSDEYDPNATSTDDAIDMIGPIVMAQLIGSYAGLQEDGTYSSAAASSIANDIAGNVRATISYKTYSLADLATDSDTSHARMLEYRSDLRDALDPLLKNAEAEFAVYARYVETSDPTYLDELAATASNYRAAAEATASVTVPRDAVNYHLAILHAMQQFASVLDSLATHADDPLASVALLRSYNTAEEGMFTSFNNLSAYYGQKTP